MKYVISRYNHDYSWIGEYSNDVVMYDRSENGLEGARIIPNRGSDIFDKFSYIIDNYDNLPDIAVYTKCNLFKYITKEEFDKVKDSKTFTPLLTQHHKTYMPVCYYEDGIYHEINNFWYLTAHPPKNEQAVEELSNLLGLRRLSYVPFAPGSNYILPKENILKHSKEFYEKLRSYLDWAIYPGEAQIIERGLYLLWR